MSSTPGRGRTEQWPSPITPLPWTASGSAERPKVLEAASRSVEGDLNGLSVLYEYTLALLEHLKELPILQANGVGWYSHPAPVWAGT